MRLVGTSELVVVGVLIAYIAFTPGFPVVRQFLSTGVGKALGLAAIVAVWKYVSHPVALLLLVNFVRCSGMRESMANQLPENTYCPADHFYDMGQCKNSTTGQSVPTVTCSATQSWNGTECIGGDPAVAPPASDAMPSPPPVAIPPAAMPSPPATSSTTMKQPFTNLTPAMAGGVQPDMKEGYSNFAPV
jgi:hypothetical protein